MKFTLVSAIAIYAGTILSTIAADASPEGKAFNHFLQIWFENQVNAICSLNITVPTMYY